VRRKEDIRAKIKSLIKLPSFQTAKQDDNTTLSNRLASGMFIFLFTIIIVAL
jgi:hypothetical protein